MLWRERRCRVDDPKQLLCVRLAIETLADEPPLLVLIVLRERVIVARCGPFAFRGGRFREVRAQERVQGFGCVVTSG